MAFRVRRLIPLALVSALRCDGGLEPMPQPTTCPAGFVGICGTVTYQGQIPDSLTDSTEAVFIVAYPTFPKSINDLLTFQPFPPPPLPRPYSGSYFYTVPLANRRYEWVVAVWKKIGSFKPNFSNADTLLREVGFYRDQATASAPGIVVVNRTGTDGIDVVIDFNDMRRICQYFPPCP